MTNNKYRLILSLAAVLGLAACNAPAYHSKANFDAAGQALGNGNVGAGSDYTAHGLGEGAQATGQAISTGAQDTGHAIDNTVNGNKN